MKNISQQPINKYIEAIDFCLKIRVLIGQTLISVLKVNKSLLCILSYCDVCPDDFGEQWPLNKYV